MTQGSLEPIDLVTYTDSRAMDLSEADSQFLASAFPKNITLHRELTSDRLVLNPKQFAGLIALPSGRLIRSRPRMPANNIFLMLAHASRVPEITHEHVVGLGTLDEMLEFVASYFADQVQSRIEKGLYRAYVEHEDNLPVVRGRIQISDDIRENFVLRHRTFCRFSELTWDVPENRVLRYTVHQLSGWPFSTDLQARLQQLDRRMGEVALKPFTPSDIDKFHYSRLNSDYEPLHRLARLLVQQMGLSEETGPTHFFGFLVDMNKLFESFVASMLDRFMKRDQAVVAQRGLYLGKRYVEDKVFKSGWIIPDLRLDGRGRVRAVLDTKFKRTGADKIYNPDFYQVLAYCTALNTTRGGLIYPRAELDQADEIAIANSSVRIRRFVIDLAVPPESLLDEAEQLVSEVQDWIGSQNTAEIPSIRTA